MPIYCAEFKNSSRMISISETHQQIWFYQKRTQNESYLVFMFYCKFVVKFCRTMEYIIGLQLTIYLQVYLRGDQN